MPGKTHAHNSIGHFDVSGPDIEALRDFYAGVFNWAITPSGPGYAAVATPNGGPDGALIEAETATLTVGVVVPDLDKALAAAELKGGTIAMPTLDNGWVKKAKVRDPSGNLLTLIQA
jgi:predicted enzyme related to lactoylglutathione lyase